MAGAASDAQDVERLVQTCLLIGDRAGWEMVELHKTNPTRRYLPRLLALRGNEALVFVLVSEKRLADGLSEGQEAAASLVEKACGAERLTVTPSGWDKAAARLMEDPR